jgi:two-component sensor histidine kinase
VLLKEQNHRVKNNMQIVSSLLNLQSRRLTDETAKRAIEESRLRVQSMAILHRRLYDGDELAEVKLADFLEEVATNSLRAFGYGNIVTQFAIDEVSLVADKAISLGLIVNELVTNACKYAFGYVNEPLLMIRCQKQDHAVLLTVADNGPGLSDWREADSHKGPVEIVRKKSFGMTLIQAQVAQLDGTYSFQTGLDDSLTGTVFRLEFTI